MTDPAHDYPPDEDGSFVVLDDDVIPPAHPRVGDDSAIAINQAIDELLASRAPGACGDPLADLHAITSLLAQLHVWLPLAVLRARACGRSWAEVGDQLGLAPPMAKAWHDDYVAILADYDGAEDWADPLTTMRERAADAS